MLSCRSVALSGPGLHHVGADLADPRAHVALHRAKPLDPRIAINKRGPYLDSYSTAPSVRALTKSQCNHDANMIRLMRHQER